MSNKLNRETADRSRFAHGIAVGAVALGVLVAVAAYASTSQSIGTGVMEHSDLVGGPATVTMRTLTIDPGEVLGWHYHPGAGAYTIVTSGVLTVEDGCGGETIYTQGQAFLEPPFRVHRGKNLTGAPIVTAQTFVVPLGSMSSVPTGQQLCGPPIERHECAGDGWIAFNHPRSFVSRGDCLQYVIVGK